MWSHSGIEEVTSFLGGASPAVDSGVVIAPYSSGELVALKVENGQVLWNDSLNGNRRYRSSTTLSSIRGRPVIDRGIVIAISNNDQIVAINLRTGRRIWDRAIGGIESPWVAGGFLFFLTNNSELVAMTRQTGRIHWIQSLPVKILQHPIAHQALLTAINSASQITHNNPLNPLILIYASIKQQAYYNKTIHPC